MKTARKLAGGPRRLEDFDSYVAARDKRIALKNDLRSVEERLSGAEKKLSGFPNSKNAAVVTVATKILDGADIDTLLASEPTDRASIEVYIEALRFRRDVIRAAIMSHEEALDRIKSTCAYELFLEIRPEHQQLMATILDHLVPLADALEAEAEFRRRMEAADVSFGLAPQLSDLAAVIGFRSAWAARVNDCWRRLADYIGRPWDHSPVKR